MASCIKRGDSFFIPFRNGQSILDSQCRPRMYKSLQNFSKSYPSHYLGTQNIEMAEYVEVVHCKDCKYCHYEFCDHYIMAHDKVNEDDFCSYGEKGGAE